MPHGLGAARVDHPPPGGPPPLRTLRNLTCDECSADFGGPSPAHYPQPQPCESKASETMAGLILGDLRLSFIGLSFVGRRPALSFIFVICFQSFYGRLTKSQGAHEWASDMVSGADVLCNLHCFSNRIRSRGLDGPPWRRMAENRPKHPGQDLSFYLP